MSDAPTTVSGNVAGRGMMLRRYKKFTVPPECFHKFQCGRQKFERWSRFLDLNDDVQSAVYDYARKNPKNTIIIVDSATGAMRSIRKRSSNGL